MKEYLQLARAHTAPLEMVPAIVGAALATGSVFNIEVGIAALLGLFYHLAGYGHNSYSDWRNGYDKEDKHKQHHPLNTGALNPDQAKKFVLGCMVTAGIIGVGISINSVDAIAYLALGVIAGVYYNEMGKETHLKFIPISFAHTSTFAVPYLAFGGQVDNFTFLHGVLFVFLWVVFQISVSGEIKDAESEEENFLRKLGLEKRELHPDEEAPMVTSYVSPQIMMYSHGLRVAIALLAGFVTLQYTSQLAYLAPIVPLGAASLYLNARMFHLWAFDREATIRDMALIEFCSLGMFLSMFAPVTGPLIAIGLAILSFAWVRVGNMYLWDTKIAPKV